MLMQNSLQLFASAHAEFSGTQALVSTHASNVMLCNMYLRDSVSTPFDRGTMYIAIC